LEVLGDEKHEAEQSEKGGGDAVAALANALAQQIAGANAAPKAKSKGDA
jgi:hypothetical protein